MLSSTFGLASIIGYTLDVFVPTLGVMILDAHPGAQGYQNFFLFIAVLSSLGLIAAYFVYRKIQRPTVQENPRHLDATS